MSCNPRPQAPKLLDTIVSILNPETAQTLNAKPSILDLVIESRPSRFRVFAVSRFRL